MQIRTLALACTAALALAAPAVAKKHMAAAPAVFPIAAQNGSGETGTVTLTPSGANATTVAVSLTGAPADAQPAHIHPGSCSKLTPAPKYPLTSLVSGKSTTVVKAPMSSLAAGGFAVNVHKSTSDLKDYVACGDLVKSAAPAPAAAPSAM